jgi:hypothetical protein
MSFLSQSEKYDAVGAAETIMDMESELSDELALKDTLDATAEDKIQDAKEFMKQNSELINSQLTKLKDLNKAIREAVVFNEKLQEEDKEYHELITSDDYLDVANKIAEFNITASGLSDFLIEHGRRGRVSLF